MTFRWIAELFDAPLKCERKGHKWCKQTRRGYRCPSEYGGAVADRVIEARTTCRRCSDVLEDWNEVERGSIQSLTMPLRDWEKLEQEGVFWS